LVGGAIGALGGLGPSLGAPSRGGASSAGSAPRGGVARPAGRPRGGAARRSVARTTSRLAGFASAVQAGGMQAGLDALGLGDIAGRPAAEVIARVADRLADAAAGQQQVLLATALRDAILEAVEPQGAAGYEDLEGALQVFLNAEGIEGLVEAFLGTYVFELVWYAIEDHVASRAETNVNADALASAVRNAARFQVRTVIRQERARGRFGGVDWFGNEGISRSEQIAAAIESQLLGARR